MQVEGRPTSASIGAIFTPALGYEFWHLIIALYMTAGFMVRGRRDRYHRLVFTLPFTMGAVLAPVQFVIGDITTRAVFLSTAREAALKPWWREISFWRWNSRDR